MFAHARTITAAGLVLVAACAEPAGPNAACAPLVNLQGVHYTTISLTVVAEAVSAEPVAEVVAQKPCIDVNPSEGDNVLQPGDSNFLAAGTTLHSVEGFPAGERLAYFGTLDGEWHVLAPLDQGS